MGDDLKEAHNYTLISRAHRENGHKYYATVFNNTCFNDNTKVECFRSLNLCYQNKIGNLMTHLDFSEDGLQLQSIIEMISLCPNLESIKLNSRLSPKFLLSVLTEIKENSPNLKSIIISEGKITPEILSALAQCSNLQSLSLKDCFGLITEANLNLPQCPNLQTLSLKDFINTSTDMLDFLISIRENSPHLNSIIINKNEITPEILSALAQCPNLQSLSIDKCENVTDQGISELAILNPTLRIVYNGSLFKE